MKKSVFLICFLCSCQWIEDHPQLVENVEDIGEDIVETVIEKETGAKVHLDLNGNGK